MQAKTVLDISKWNVIDNYKLFTKNADAVILRLGYRSFAKGDITMDPKFKTHYENLKKIGIPIGVYFFTTAITSIEAKEEAAWVIKAISGLDICKDIPIFVDTEMSNNEHNGRSDKLNKYTRTDCVVTFCNLVTALSDYKAGIYASDDWFVSQLNYNEVKKYPKWVARYGGKKPEKVKDNIIGWQMTDGYPVAGTKKGVDMSEWYGELPGKKAITEASTKAPKIEAGKAVRLQGTRLYSGASVPSYTSSISGLYYLWDDKVKNERIRITNSVDGVGKTGKITGWIHVRDIK